MKKKTLIIMFLTLILVAAAGLSIHTFHTPAATSQPVKPVLVQTMEVRESTLPLEVEAIGTLVARSVDITPEVAGHVQKILFQDGSFIKARTPLFQLDDAVYKAQYESAKAQLAYSENDYKRKSLLGKQGAIARQAIDQAEADLKQKQAIAQESAVMIQKMQLTAPFSGMVGQSKVNPGDYVTTGQRLLTLTDTKHLRIEYTVPEQFLPLLKPGQTVTIRSATYPDKVFIGKVSFISPTINIENRSVSLYADVSNKENLLAAGMFVEVKQSLGKKKRAIMIPARSLVPVLDGEQIYKVVDGKAYGLTVLVGKRLNGQIQIREGLSPGDVIITDGQLKVKNGMPVQVKT